MKLFLHKILSFSLATLVLMTTMSFTVDMHYCGDTLVDISLFTNAETCGMEKQQSADECENGATKDSCCSDEQIVLESHDRIKTTFDSSPIGQQIFVATLFYSYINLFEGLEKNIVPFRDYTPPFFKRDIQKLHETYLI